jgi:heme-degrading monooxygenase HmoA
MVLEVAILNIRAGEAAAFENAFAHAQAIIAKMAGYHRYELRHCIEQPDRYVLLLTFCKV